MTVVALAMRIWTMVGEAIAAGVRLLPDRPPAVDPDPVAADNDLREGIA